MSGRELIIRFPDEVVSRPSVLTIIVRKIKTANKVAVKGCFVLDQNIMTVNLHRIMIM